jgi:transposase
MPGLEEFNTPIDYGYELLKNELEQQFEQIRRSNPLLFPPPHKNTTINDLTVLQALLYIAKNGCTWRKLPEEFGNWSSIHTRFSDWEKKWAVEGTTDLIERELNVIDWTALNTKHTLTRRRVLKGFASKKENHKDTASDADNTFTPNGHPNNLPNNAPPDDIKDKDLSALGIAKSDEENTESAVSSAENLSALDTVTDEAAQSGDKNPSSGTATQQTPSDTSSQQDSNVDPSILTGGVPGKYEAKAIMTGTGKMYKGAEVQRCRVLTGSTIKPTEVDSMTYGAQKLREKLIGWVIKDNKFVKDYTFASPTVAAEVVCGYKISPTKFWKGLKESSDNGAKNP